MRFDLVDLSLFAMSLTAASRMVRSARI